MQPDSVPFQMVLALKICLKRFSTGSSPVSGTRKADTRLGCLLFVSAPGERTFSRVKVPKSPGSGKA